MGAGASIGSAGDMIIPNYTTLIVNPRKESQSDANAGKSDKDNAYYRVRHRLVWNIRPCERASSGAYRN